jgi:hypothetical protein
MDGYYTVSVAALLETLFVLELGSNKVAVALLYSKWPSCLLIHHLIDDIPINNEYIQML